jgi:hypothetical protein
VQFPRWSRVDRKGSVIIDGIMFLGSTEQAGVRTNGHKAKIVIFLKDAVPHTGTVVARIGLQLQRWSIPGTINLNRLHAFRYSSVLSFKMSFWATY